MLFRSLPVPIYTPLPWPGENFPQPDIGVVCPFSGNGAEMQRNTGYFPTESLEPSGNRLFSRSALNEGYLFRGSLIYGVMYNCLLKYIVRYIVEQYNELLSNIGQVIFKERKSQKLTRAALAEKAGLSIQTINKVEHGQNTNFKIETFVAILKALNLSADYVLGNIIEDNSIEWEINSLSARQKAFLLSVLRSLKEYDKML